MRRLLTSSLLLISLVGISHAYPSPFCNGGDLKDLINPKTGRSDLVCVGGGGGSSIYNSTATAGFPYGFSVSTISNIPQNDISIFTVPNTGIGHLPSGAISIFTGISNGGGGPITIHAGDGTPTNVSGGPVTISGGKGTGYGDGGTIELRPGVTTGGGANGQVHQTNGDYVLDAPGGFYGDGSHLTGISGGGSQINFSSITVGPSILGAYSTQEGLRSVYDAGEYSFMHEVNVSSSAGFFGPDGAFYVSINTTSVPLASGGFSPLPQNGASYLRMNYNTMQFATKDSASLFGNSYYTYSPAQFNMNTENLYFANLHSPTAMPYMTFGDRSFDTYSLHFPSMNNSFQFPYNTPTAGDALVADDSTGTTHWGTLGGGSTNYFPNGIWASTIQVQGAASFAGNGTQFSEDSTFFGLNQQMTDAFSITCSNAGTPVQFKSTYSSSPDGFAFDGNLYAPTYNLSQDGTNQSGLGWEPYSGGTTLFSPTNGLVSIQGFGETPLASLSIISANMALYSGGAGEFLITDPLESIRIHTAGNVVLDATQVDAPAYLNMSGYLTLSNTGGITTIGTSGSPVYTPSGNILDDGYGNMNIVGSITATTLAVAPSAGVIGLTGTAVGSTDNITLGSDGTALFATGATTIDSVGNVTAKSLIKSGGTSSQVLMADGSTTNSIPPQENSMTGKTSAQSNVLTWSSPSTGYYRVTAWVFPTSAVNHSFNVKIAYKDDNGTSKNLILPFMNETGSLVTTISSAAGNINYNGIPMLIHANSGQNLVVSTSGTFTSVTYNIRAIIEFVK